MRASSLVLLCALLTLCLAPLQRAEASGPTGPRFTWSSFQRFWDKQGTPLVYLTTPEAVQGGYLVNYGHGVTLQVLLQDQVVTGVDIRFVGGKANEAGGPQFKRLVYHAITVGSFRWPGDKIEEVRHRFAIFSPQDKEYHYQMTRFRYTSSPSTGPSTSWTFGFEYVPAEER